jgi:hypothetical protein
MTWPPAPRRLPGLVALAAVLACAGCGDSSHSDAPSSRHIDPRSLVLRAADLPGPYTVEDRGAGGGGEGVPADLAAAYRESGAFLWFYAVTYRPLVRGGEPSSVQTAELVLPSTSAAERIYREAGSLVRYFYGSPMAVAEGTAAVGEQGTVFWTTGLDSGQPARARVVVWRSANVLALVGVVGADEARAFGLAQRQQRHIESATGGHAIAMPALQAGSAPRPAARSLPSYRRLRPATATGLPVSIDHAGTWSLEKLGAGGPISIAPGSRGVGLPFRVTSAAGGGVLRLHVRVDLSPDAAPGRELDLVGAIDGAVSISSRLSAAFDPRTGALHVAGDDVADTTQRQVEFTSEQIVPAGALGQGAHELEMRLEPALDGGLRAIRAVILPDSAIVVAP